MTAGVIIDEPFSILLSNKGLVSMDNANKFADEPEFTIIAFSEPIYSQNFSSNILTFSPIVTHVDSIESSASTTSS